MPKTETFTYQGKLTDNSLAANGTYDFQFILLTGSRPAAGPDTHTARTTVTNGIFTVQLDFSTDPAIRFCPGSDMVMQTRRQETSRSFVHYLTRPTDHSFRTRYVPSIFVADLAADSQKLGGVNANQYVLTGECKDER
jgi:hypothetical protein